MVAEHVLRLLGSGLIYRSLVALEPVAGELVKAGVLLSGIEFERIRRSPCAAADQAGDLVTPIGRADVVPAFALGAERNPVALSVGAYAQAVGVLAVAFAVALDDCADGLGPGAPGSRRRVRWGHSCLRRVVGGTTLRLVNRGGSGSGPRFARGREPAEARVPTRQAGDRGFARGNGASVCVRCPVWWLPAPRRARTPTRGRPRAGERPPAHRAIPSDGPAAS
jgi:hypothetical protein